MNSILLNGSSKELQFLSAKDKRLSKLFSIVGPIEYTLPTDYYVFLVEQIINQMLSNKAGDAILARLVEKCNGRVCVDAICRLNDDDMKKTGLSRYKVEYIRSITEAVKYGGIDFDSFWKMTDAEVINSLTRIRGIGPWSAKMFLRFAMDRQDILPYEDVAFLQSYKWLYKTDDITPQSIMKKCKKWSPYSSVAARYLYRALDNGYTKKEFHLYTAFQPE